jgi:outer membrane biosynthesis protein TonB
VPASFTKAWLEARESARRKGFVQGLVVSFVLHLGVGLFFMFSPAADPVPLPDVITVRMVSLPAARKAAPAPSPPAPAAPPTPAKPAPTPKKVVLPKQPSSVKKKAKPKPQPKPKAKPKPEPLEYDDALAALRDELGEETPVEPVEEVPDVMQQLADAVAAEEAQQNSATRETDPDVLAWSIATRRHLKNVWIVPADFLSQSLKTRLVVTLSAAGDVIGTPEIVATSGNPYFDDNTVRALVRASPLPAPPEPGDWPFHFNADEGF